MYSCIKCQQRCGAWCQVCMTEAKTYPTPLGPTLASSSIYSLKIMSPPRITVDCYVSRWSGGSCSGILTCYTPKFHPTVPQQGGNILLPATKRGQNPFLLWDPDLSAPSERVTEIICFIFGATSSRCFHKLMIL